MFLKWWTEHSSPHNRYAKTLAACAIGLSLISATGCSLLPKEQAEEALPTINPPKLSKKPEYVVKTDTLVTKVPGGGQLLATKEEPLSFEDDGKKIKAVHVKPGDSVTQGQTIAELDVALLVSQLQDKQIQIRKDELEMKQLLRNTDGKTPEEVEKMKIDFDVKRKSIEDLSAEIGRAALTAPFSGTVVAVYATKGDTSKAFEAVALLADLAQLTVAVSMNPDDLKKVAPGMEAVVDINGAGQLNGKVKRMPIPRADQPGGGDGGFPQGPGQGKGAQQSLDQFLLIELDQMPEGVSRGTPLSVSVITDKKENAVVIPPAALRSVSGRTYVQVMDEKGAKREVDVEVGLQTATAVEIVKGLQPGQKVVGK